MKPKFTGTLGVAAFLSLHRTGQRFGLFKPNGTEVAKKGPGWRGVGGRNQSALTRPTQGSADLAHFGLPFGALWLTLGSLWLTFGSLLVPFGSLLVSWAHFWRSWRSIFSLLVPPSVIFHISFYNMDGILVPKPAHRHLHA